MAEHEAGTLFVRRDAGLVKIIESFSIEDDDYVSIKDGDNGLDAVGPTYFAEEYVKLTREMAEQLHAMGFAVPNDVGDE